MRISNPHTPRWVHSIKAGPGRSSQCRAAALRADPHNFQGNIVESTACRFGEAAMGSSRRERLKRDSDLTPSPEPTSAAQSALFSGCASPWVQWDVSLPCSL